MPTSTPATASAAVERLQSSLERARADAALLKRSLAEARARERSAAAVAKVMARLTNDPQPAFEAIVDAGGVVCGKAEVRLYLAREDSAECVAASNGRPSAKERREALATSPSIAVRAIRERKVVHVEEDGRDRGKTKSPKRRGVIAVPLIQRRNAIGVLCVTRPTPGLFPSDQVAFLKKLADQAILAIDRTRLQDESQAKLKQLAAIGEILHAISSSPTSAQPTFDAIVKAGRELFEDMDVSLRLVKGDCSEVVASTAWIRVGVRHAPTSRPLQDRNLAATQSIADAGIVERKNTFAGPRDKERDRQSRLLDRRAVIAFPLIEMGKALGAVSLQKKTVGPFSQNQVNIMKMFADHAVIALRNIRQFEALQAWNAELTQSLEQQATTNEILRVISSSPTSAQPVFDAIVNSGLRLFEGMDLSLRLLDGEYLDRVASTVRPGVSGRRSDSRHSLRDTWRGGIRAVLSGEVVQVPDILANDRFGAPPISERANMFFRSFLSAPLISNGKPIGVITATRPTPGPFSDRQIEQIKTFARQAVIALENVRLFTELQARNAELSESLDQQTATSEVLRIISRSTTDTQPVFDAIVNSAARLFGGLDVALRLVRGDRVHLVAATRADWQSHGGVPMALGGPVAKVVERKETIQLSSADNLPEHVRDAWRRRGIQAVVVSPLMRGAKVIGALVVSRGVPERFSEKQVALLEVFADQAVIAIENVRLFKELGAKNAALTEALNHQKAITRILEAISHSQADAKPVFEAIVDAGVEVFGGTEMSLRLIKGEFLERVASSRDRDAPASMRGEFVVQDRDASGSMRGELLIPAYDPTRAQARAILLRKVVQLPDILSDDTATPKMMERRRLYDWRAMSLPRRCCSKPGRFPRKRSASRPPMRISIDS